MSLLFNKENYSLDISEAGTRIESFSLKDFIDALQKKYPESYHQNISQEELTLTFS